ncbi:MAG: MoxR family ATPase, partial [Phycisphaeraceae bacterium]|nr:MoxR family ATPase [Phycisphaeraceae bacterium]
AQLDRFMLMIEVGYPGEEEEMEIVRRTTTTEEMTVDPIMDAEEVMRVQSLVRDVPVPDHVVRYALRLVRATREPGRDEADLRDDYVRQYLSWGAGPRASQNLVLAAKARAVLDGRSHAVLEDLTAVAHPVLRHRLLTSFSAEADGVKSDDVIDHLLESIHPDESGGTSRSQMDAVMR